MSRRSVAPTFYLWLRWPVFFWCLGLGFGIGLSALGWHDATGHRVFDVRVVLGLAGTTALSFALMAAIAGAIGNWMLVAAFRGRDRPLTWFDRQPFSPAVLGLWTVLGLTSGVIMWLFTVNRR